MRKLILMAVMLAMMLVMAAPASAQTVEVGNLVAGPISESITVAGDPNLTEGPIPELPPGSDIAATGDIVPPGVFAAGVNIPFTVDFGVAGVAAEEDDTLVQSSFIGTDSIEVGSGNLSADTENAFLD